MTPPESPAAEPGSHLARTARPRVLLLAEAANPEWVSVPLVGWSLARAIQGVTDAHLVTQVRNRDAILRAGLVEGRDFTAIDTEALAAPLWRAADRLGLGRAGGWSLLTAISALSYPLFERKVWACFGAQIAGGGFDIVHRITPVSLAIDSPIARRCAKAGVPFVLGPVNGALPWPPGFDDHRRRERDRWGALRGLARGLRGRASMLDHAALILCGARSAWDDLPAAARGRSLILPENGIDPTRFHRRAVQDASLPLRGCFIGRLTALKGVDLLIDAAAPLLADGRMLLQIVGDGPERPALEAQVAALGLGDAVRFHGWLDHTQVQDVAARCHLLTFPSLRDFGGGAVLEGMALGLVPVVLDYGGPAELVDDATGFRIPMGSPAEVTARLRDRLTTLADDPAVLAGMAERCRETVARDLVWDAKAARIVGLYQEILARA